MLVPNDVLEKEKEEVYAGNPPSDASLVAVVEIQDQVSKTSTGNV